MSTTLFLKERNDAIISSNDNAAADDADGGGLSQ
jgi:hypothetical protein